MDNTPLLEATGLVRHYGRHPGVADIDLSVAPGDVVGLLGVNGAGKSTILQLLAGTLAPHAGRIRIAGHDLARAPSRAKRHIGYLAERPALYGELTVDESLDLAARLQQIPRAARRDAVASAKHDTGLADIGRRLVGGLSKGTAQRVGLAQAIVHRPALLLLDEPTSGLDPSQLRGMRELIARLSADHAVILSSHLLAEIQAVATRTVIVAGGRIVLDGPMSDDETRWIEITCLRAPAPDALTGFTEIQAAEAMGAGRVRLRGAPGTDIRARVVELSVIHNWGLVGLRASGNDLEHRFMTATGQTPARHEARP